MDDEFAAILQEFNRRRAELMQQGFPGSAWDELFAWSIQAILESLRARDENASQPGA
jgi:hypothetical protein